MEAFVYSWSDHKTAKIYVGVHKGSPNDGYVCSSKPMKAEYAQRPEDFTRQIIAAGTLNDCTILEVAIIKQLLKEKDTCYNRAAGKMIINDVHPMLGKAHSDEAKRKISLNAVGNKSKHFSSEHKKKIGNAQLGNKNHMYGKTHDAIAKEKIAIASKSWVRTEAVKRKISESNKGKTISQETRQKLIESHLGQIAWNKGCKLSDAHKQKIKDSWARRKLKKRVPNA